MVDLRSSQIVAPIGPDSINTVPDSDDRRGNDGKFYWATRTASSNTGAAGGITTVGFDQVGQPPAFNFISGSTIKSAKW